MDAQVLSLMIWIGSVTGYSVPPVPPEVVYVTEDEISILYCGKVLERCKIGGLYPWGSNKVFINQDQTVGGRAVIVVHELTHYMQNRNHKYPSTTDCEDRINREIEAYIIEKQYGMIHFPQIGRKIKAPPEINIDLCHKKQ